MADREIERKEEIEANLVFISRQLGQLRIIQNLPQIGIPPDAVLNRAIDVRSAALAYIATQIQYEAAGEPGVFRNIQCVQSMTYLGSTLSTFFIGDEDWKSVGSALQKSVEDFNKTLSHFGVGAVFEALHKITRYIVLFVFS